ncbi:MAG: Lrp/AsnC family transcriptional regulator [Gemmatimonadetes bacterium]|nr:Lrp/AsnC family transcriptional regulator [Gemmatimonadota bacterium]
MTLDAVDRRILRLLQSDGKLSYQEIGEAVGLSAPAAFQRVRKLESSGAITGYHARVAPAALDRAVLAFIEAVPDGAVDQGLLRRWHKTPAIQECHRLSGTDRFLLKVRCGSQADLVELVDAVRRAGCAVRTEIALETEFERWTVG